MPVANLPSLEQRLDAAVAQVAGDERRLADLQHKVRHLQTQLNAAQRPKRVAGEPAEVDEELIASLSEEIAADQKTVVQLQARVTAGQAEVDQARHALAQALTDPMKGIESLSLACPIALLPVRMETRFVKATAGGTELRIRFYPDDIQSDGHETGLSDNELAWGQRFANLTRTAHDDGAKRQAWTELAGHFGPRRAAWIAGQVAPLGPDGIVGPALTTGKRTGRPPQTTTLPDHWVVIGYQGGKRSFIAWGSRISQPLAVGPAPQAAAAGAGDFIDPGMRWMVDFDEAEKAGMGIRVPLVGSQVDGFERLLAVGVTLGGDSTGANDANRLTSALNAHHYLNGLEFLQPGTPTNNTDAGRAGHSSAVPNAADSFDLERGPSRLNPKEPDREGFVSSSALGIASPVFAHVAGADWREHSMAKTMKQALWPATWGYYLQNLLGGVLTQDQIDLARQYFGDHVWASGPLLSLKVGDLPYGILPVTALSLWKPVSGQDGVLDAALATFLVRLRDIWLQAITSVPRVGAHPADPDGDLVTLLGMDAMSSRYEARAVVGRHLIRAIHGLLVGGITLPGSVQSPGAALLRSLGIGGAPRLSLVGYAPDPRPVPGALVIDPSQRDVAYLAWLGDQLSQPAGVETIWRQPVPAGYSAAPLLYRLLRYAVLREFAVAAFEVLNPPPPGAPAPTYPPEPELIDLVVPPPHRRPSRRAPPKRGTIPEDWWTDTEDSDLPDPPETETDWRRLHKPHPSGRGTVGRYLCDQVALYVRGTALAKGDPAWRLCRMHDYLVGHQEVLGLAQIAVDGPDGVHVLERLLSTTLDLSAHRLDAWITSFATKRLRMMRDGQPTGLHLGGYGWLENLKPAPPSSSDGFVHAPSTDHAATAAVLRSGYRSHAGGGTGKANPLQIDLSSARVRSALELTEGVRSGQSLGALLGYRFERALLEAHEQSPPLGLASLLYPIRALAPLKAGKLTPASAPDSRIDFNVVDGLALLQPGINWNVVPFLPKTRDVVNGILASLQDSLHAMSDATTAEAVFQLVRGNVVRAGAALDAMSRGDALPPELQVVNSQRSGVAFTHRVMILVDQTAPATAWPQGSLRSLADPPLNAWVGNILGDPAHVVCGVQYVATKANQPAGSATLTLQDLGLAPLDLLALVSGRGQPQATELDQRFVDLARRRATAPPESTPRLDYHPSGLRADQIALGDFLEFAHALRDLVFGAKALQGRDLMWGPTAGSGAALDTAELGRRWSAVQQALQKITAATIGSAAAALQTAAQLGVAGAVPTSDDPATQAAQANRIAADLARRLSIATAALKAPQTATGAPDYAAALRAALGNDLPLLPPFGLDTGSAKLLSDAFAGSTALQGDDQAAIRWMHNIARVRPAVARFERAALYGETLGRFNQQLEVAQLPYHTGDRWLALQATDGAGGVGIVAHKPATINPARVAGLLIDEWVETIPAARETTAIAFHYDALTAQAPQAILLAVPPDRSRPWSLEVLEAVLLETLDLAKIRAVDGDLLGDVGQFLPALYTAHNPEPQDAISEGLA